MLYVCHSNASWICCNCGLPNFSSSLFCSATETHLSNSFQVLDDPDASIDCNDESYSRIGSPQLCSSPKKGTQAGKCSAKTNKAGSIKAVVLNAQSIMAKQEDIWLLIDSCDPDIIVCMETWLTSTITDAEVLPPGYVTYRNDRKDGYGSVLVAIKRKLGSVDICTHLDPCLCEFKAVTFETNKQTVIVCSAYRPPNRDTGYQEKLCSHLEDIVHSNPGATIWFAGDLNIPDRLVIGIHYWSSLPKVHQ